MDTTKKVMKALDNEVLGNAFMVTALESYSRQVLMDHSDWGNALVAKDLWQDIAGKVVKAIESSREKAK